MSESDNSEHQAAESRVAEAESRLDLANREKECAECRLNEAERQLESARKEVQQLQSRYDILSQALEKSAIMLEETTRQYSAKLATVDSLITEANRRIGVAQAAIDGYLRNHPSAASVARWLRPSVSSSTVLRPNDLHSRLHLSRPQLEHFITYLASSDHAFHSRIQDYRQQLKSCRGSAEVLHVQQKVRKYLSGYLGEAVVCHAFKPFAEKVDTQRRTYFNDGHYTKTDVMVEGLKVPVVLGKGGGRYAPAGGSIGIEVKCGQKQYLYSQKEHLIFQSRGHKDADAAITLCSEDIQDLSEEKAEELRGKLRNAGSPMLGMLPRKEEIDAVCWAFVNGKKAED